MQASSANPRPPAAAKAVRMAGLQTALAVIVLVAGLGGTAGLVQVLGRLENQRV